MTAELHTSGSMYESFVKVFFFSLSAVGSKFFWLYIVLDPKANSHGHTSSSQPPAHFPWTGLHLACHLRILHRVTAKKSCALFTSITRRIFSNFWSQGPACAAATTDVKGVKSISNKSRLFGWLYFFFVNYHLVWDLVICLYLRIPENFMSLILQDIIIIIKRSYFFLVSQIIRSFQLKMFTFLNFLNKSDICSLFYEPL